jgi:hypothetical protein
MIEWYLQKKNIGDYREPSHGNYSNYAKTRGNKICESFLRTNPMSSSKLVFSEVHVEARRMVVLVLEVCSSHSLGILIE